MCISVRKRVAAAAAADTAAAEDNDAESGPALHKYELWIYHASLCNNLRIYSYISHFIPGPIILTEYVNSALS